MNSSIQIRKINKEKVKPIPILVDSRPVKGGNLSPDPYMNVFLLAPTNSGKTCCLFHILKKIIGPKTNIIAFVSTQNMDESWNHIENYFEKEKIPIIIHDEIEENGVNHLDELIEYWKASRKKKNEEKEEINSVDLIKQLNHIHNVEDSESEDEKIQKKVNYRYPENILVFDDMGDYLRDHKLNNFLKRSRHYKVKVLISGHDWTDLCPAARKQMKQFLIFHSNGINRLNSIYENMDCQIPFEQFKKLYDEATIITKNNPKPFLFAIPSQNDYRICFDKKFVI